MKMKRYVEIGESFLLLIDDYSIEKKKEIKNGLERYVFTNRKQEDSNPHPNSIKAKGKLKAPNNYAEAILKIMHPYYNANTANRVRDYIIKKL